MVDYLTAKLRRDKFDPLLSGIEDVATMKTKSKNNLVGACVFFTHFFCTQKLKNGKTLFQMTNDLLKKKPEETILCMLGNYYRFLENNSSNEQK